jgi:predicted DNA-binding transcriptional regulator AlpA
MKSFSIDDWCAMHALSRSFYYKLDKLGQAPKSFKVGRTVRISETANDEWLSAREAAQVAA